ncbi:MAG TPA: VWA domain-containing protein [Blastocatellia bacterium]|nr:VWA domain-containing protein [Blastocatellia bacterium]
MRLRIAVTALAVIFGVTSFGLAQKPGAQKKPPAPAGSQVKEKPKTQADDDMQLSGGDTVKLGTELVNVMFSAVDRNNRVVSDVRQEDIIILEDGKPQEVFTFKREATLPINIAILMDLSGSQEYTFPKEKAAAGEFLRSIIRPNTDSAAIVTFQDDVELAQGLTSRIESLNRAFDEIQFSRRFGPATTRRQATALYDAVYITADEILARDGYRAVSDETPTRRAIILLTDGVDNASSRKLDEAIERAWRSGVVIYAIGIGDRFRFEGVREDILRRMAEETGGRAYFPHGPDDLRDDFRQIESELRSQYLVAYSPSNTARDGSFRRIEVRLANRPDLRIVHRRGYYAPTEEVQK